MPEQGTFTEEGAFNSDIAFQGDHAYAGNYKGFAVFDISDPAAVVTEVVCPGSQNDISVLGQPAGAERRLQPQRQLLRERPAVGDDKEAWEGIRVFDIADPSNPRYIAAVETSAARTPHAGPRRHRRERLRLRVVDYPNGSAPTACRRTTSSAW